MLALTDQLSALGIIVFIPSVAAIIDKAGVIKLSANRRPVEKIAIAFINKIT